MKTWTFTGKGARTGKPVSGWRPNLHKPDGLDRETPQKLLVKVLELDEQTRHTLVRTKHGDE